MSDITKIKTRIAKLLKIAEDSTYPNEVETALLKVQKLFVKYKIDEADIDMNEKPDVVTEFIKFDGNVSQWKKILIDIIAKNFNSVAYVNTKRNYATGRNVRSFGIIGRKDDVDIIIKAYNTYTYAIVASSLNYRKENPTNWARVKKSYMFGFVHGLKDSFKKQKEENIKWEMVLVKDKEIEKKCAQINLKYSKATVDLHSTDAHTKGYEAGSRYNTKKCYSGHAAIA